MNAGPARLAGPGVGRRPSGLVVSSPACSASCMRLAISAQCPYGAATDSMTMAALWTTSGLALVKRAKNFPARGCIGRPMRACPGQRYRPQCIDGYSQRGIPAPGGIPAEQAEDTSCARRQQAIQPAASVAWQRHLRG